MHASKLASLLVLLALLCGAGIASAQTQQPAEPLKPSDSSLIAQLDQATGGTQLFRHAATGKVRFLTTTNGQPLQKANSLTAGTPEQAARAFLGSYGQLFGLRNSDRELTVMQQEQLAGHSFVRFQQVYQGIPIMGGELVVQTDQQRAVISANGEVLPDLQLAVQPSVTAADAAQQAITLVAKYYGATAEQLHTSTPQLWIYDPAILGGPGRRVARLVWRIDVTAGASTSAAAIRELVLIDAQTGKVALNFSQIAEGKNRIVCNDNNVADTDGNQDNNCVPAKYARVEGQGPTGVEDVDKAYDYAGATYDYFFNNFGRDSLNGKGLPLISLVKYCPNLANCPFQNANWDGHQMTYGDGFASADDVVAHELTHGFTEFTSHLYYYYQSGAINESLSDVFGELVDQTDGLGTDTPGVKWQMGEDLTSIGVIRNMQDPTIFGDPDRMTSGNYSGSSADRGGVHTNSGVNNKAAFLMTDGTNGGTFNGQTITGLGTAKVGAIYYTLQVAFLTSASDYQDMYTDLPAACNVLAASGAYGLSAADCTQVQKAVTATEMNTTPPAAPVPEAPICAAGQTSQDTFFDDLENLSSGNWAISAAQSSVAWYYPATSNPYNVSPINFDGIYATSGTQNFYGDDPPSVRDTSIAMTRNVAIPANAFLHFRHAFGFETGVATYYDGGVVEYSTNNGATWNDVGPLFTHNGYNAVLATGGDNPLESRQAFGDVSQGYLSSRANLSALAGQNVRFRFRIGTDLSGADEGWYVDDVRIYTCNSATPAVSLKTATATVAETAGSLTLQVQLSGASSQNVTVPFTVGGSATENTDYRLFGHAFVIPAGSRSGTVILQPTKDATTEPTESVVLTLGSPSGATLAGGNVMTITIQDGAGSRRIYLPLMRK